MKGKFITVEGSDGSGKTTFLNFISEYLTRKGYKVVITREPGGTEFSEKIRELLFDASNDIDAKTESLLFCASRRDHIVKKILPLLKEGYIVICDRFVDSSIAYQSYGRGLKENDIVMINKYVTEDLEPNLTLYFKVDVKTGLNRTKNRDDNNRMDLEKISFYERVKEGYDILSEKNTDRIKIIDANLPYLEVEKKALEEIEKFLGDNNV